MVYAIKKKKVKMTQHDKTANCVFCVDRGVPNSMAKNAVGYPLKQWGFGVHRLSQLRRNRVDILRQTTQVTNCRFC